jgi:hypothetical protein
MEDVNPEPLSSGSSEHSLVDKPEAKIVIDQGEDDIGPSTSVVELNGVEEGPKSFVRKIFGKTEKKEMTHLEQEMHTLRRIAFFGFLVAEFVIIVWGI